MGCPLMLVSLLDFLSSTSQVLMPDPKIVCTVKRLTGKDSSPFSLSPIPIASPLKNQKCKLHHTAKRETRWDERRWQSIVVWLPLLLIVELDRSKLVKQRNTINKPYFPSVR